MKKQEFDEQYEVINKEIESSYTELIEKYKEVYTDGANPEEKYGEDFPKYKRMLELTKQSRVLVNTFHNQELYKQDLFSDSNVDISVAIEVHDILLEKKFYQEHLNRDEDFDMVKVIYHCVYNDNWNDLLVAKLQLFKNYKFVREIVVYDMSQEEKEDFDYDHDYWEQKQKYEIEMYHSRPYSHNEAFQSFVVRKEKCEL